MEFIEIKKINSNAAEDLSKLAKSIYVQHYAHLWLEGGMDWYMNEYAYPTEKIKIEIEDKNCLHYIVYFKNKAVAYLKLNIDAALEGDNKKEGFELERIYIDINFVKKGLGAYLMNYVAAIARSYQKKYIFLKAMDSASVALQFYSKMGYEIVGSFRLSDATFHLMKEKCRGMYNLKKLL